MEFLAEKERVGFFLDCTFPYIFEVPGAILAKEGRDHFSSFCVRNPYWEKKVGVTFPFCLPYFLGANGICVGFGFGGGRGVIGFDSGFRSLSTRKASCGRVVSPTN